MVTGIQMPIGATAHLARVLPDQGDAVLICLLGQFRLLRGERALNLFIAGKAAALLSTLALHLGSGVPRETLLDTLWPEQDAMQATVSLNSLVYSLHRRLRVDVQGEAAVVNANGSYFLNTAAGYSTDIAYFDASAASGDRMAATGRDRDAALHYDRAAAAYGGDLCTGTDVYAVIERERLRASFLTVLAWLAGHACQDADYTAAMGYAMRILACDPCREDAHRVVMRARVHRGERAQALRQYRLCQEILRREFDAVPEPLTTELFERIRVDPGSI